jgi:hypothetical protein
VIEPPDRIPEDFGFLLDLDGFLAPGFGEVDAAGFEGRVGHLAA